MRTYIVSTPKYVDTLKQIVSIIKEKNLSYSVATDILRDAMECIGDVKVSNSSLDLDAFLDSQYHRG